MPSAEVGDREGPFLMFFFHFSLRKENKVRFGFVKLKLPARH